MIFTNYFMCLTVINYLSLLYRPITFFPLLIVCHMNNGNILLDLRIFGGIKTCTGEATATGSVNQLIV